MESLEFEKIKDDSIDFDTSSFAVSRTAQIAGEGERPAVNMSVRFGDFEEVEIEVNLRDRTKLDRKFLLGRNFMSMHNILVDSKRTPNKLPNDQLECTPKY